MEEPKISQIADHPDRATDSPAPTRRTRRGVYLLPNLITTGALFSGFYAIIAAMGGLFENAAIAIVIAGLLDSLDGRIARMTNTQTEFGVQYDSLSDLVAFGVAPAVLLFSWVLVDFGKVGWMLSFLYMACAALRLARFNTAPETKSFRGLASPAAAGTMSTMVWLWQDNLQPLGSLPAEVPIQIALAIAVLSTVTALLMVSNVRYYSPKSIDLKGRVPFFYMLGIIFLFVIVFIYPPGMLFAIGIVYSATGPVQALLRKSGAKEDVTQTGQ